MTEEVQIIQADIDAADECCTYWFTRVATCTLDIEQMFARHRIASQSAEVERLREALANCVSALRSVRKNYEDRDSGLWRDVSRFIKAGNAALAIKGEWDGCTDQGSSGQAH